MLVKSKTELKNAYELLLLIQETIRENPTVDREKANETVVKCKKDIRSYYRRQREELNTSLVKDYGIDGYIEKIELPFMFSKDEAKRYVESNIVMEYYPSQYDCTGQCFTSWYRVFKNSKNRYICYHRVSVDC